MGHKRNSAKAVRRQLQALVRLQPLRRDLEESLESDGLNMADPTLYSDVGAHPVSVAGLYDGYRVGAGTLECSLEARRITGSEGVDEGAVLGYAARSLGKWGSGQRVLGLDNHGGDGDVTAHY